MNTRGRNNGTTTLPPNKAHACPAHRGRSPAVEGHHTDRRTLQEPEGRCGRFATTHRRAHAAGVPHRPPADGETTRQPRDRLVSPEAPTMDVKAAATGPAINRADPGQADLARERPLPQPDNARPRNTLRRRPSVGRAGENGVELPGLCSGHQRNAG